MPVNLTQQRMRHAARASLWATQWGYSERVSDFRKGTSLEHDKAARASVRDRKKRIHRERFFD